MQHILYVQSSLHREDGASSTLGAALVADLREAHPGSTVTTLDLAALSLPHLDTAEFQAWSVPEAARTEQQAALAARSDGLIDQLLAHDTLVLAVPMYNLAVPSTLKAWIDRIVRAGRTFRYTSDGPQGLVTGVDAYAVFARGGLYRGTPLDTQTGYVNAVLGLIGITNVTPVFAEGLAMGTEKRDQSLDRARDAIASLAGRDHREVRYANA